MKRMLVCAVSAFAVAAVTAHAVRGQQLELARDVVVALSGDWAGRIQVDATRGQDVLWRFDQMPSGPLLGFMGPAATGAATIPMQRITSDGEALSFTVDSQGGAFVGTISGGEAAGVWRQGQSRPVNLTRSTQGGAPATGGGAFSVVLGQWEVRQGDTRDGPPMTLIRFELGDSGALVGFTGNNVAAVTTRLASVTLDDSVLRFEPPAQPGRTIRFTGQLSRDRATGSVFDGVEAPIRMRKTN